METPEKKGDFFAVVRIYRNAIIRFLPIIVLLIILPITILVLRLQQQTRQQAATTNGDLSSYPHPKFDTGIGIHWDASGGSNDPNSARNNICTLKDIGVSWIKIVVNGDSTVDFAKVMKDNDIEPIVRIARPKTNPNRISQDDMDSITDYAQAGASYFEINNEPNLRDEWSGSFPLPCNNVAAKTMETWSKDAVEVQKKGGYPLFPGLAPTGTSDVSCEDSQFVSDSFDWLKTNQCVLADGSTGLCLDIFDSTKSRGKPAIMNVHNYSLDSNQNGDLGGDGGFGKFIKYDELVKGYLGRSVPIISTEGGPTRDSTQAPGNNNPEAHKKIAVAEASYQMNNTSPYYFATAFWLSHYSGLGDPGARDQVWYNWQPKSTKEGDGVVLTPRFTQTIDALKALQKKSRNGTSAPTTCTVVGSPTTTVTQPTTTTPTSATTSPTPATCPTPNPLSCGGIDPASTSDNLFKNGSFGGPNNDSLDNIYANWNTFGEAEFDTGTDNIDGANVRIDASGNFKAGVYQTVEKLKPGTWYIAYYVTAQKVFGPNNKVDGSLPILREIGVDTTGGTNPAATNVKWGRSSGGKPDTVIQADGKARYGGWKTLDNQNNPLISFKATGTKATIFLRASGWPDVVSSRTWMDSAILTEACDTGNFCDGTQTTPTTTPGQPTEPTTPPPAGPGASLLPGSCSIDSITADTSGIDTKLTITYSGQGGNVTPQIAQKGEPNTTSADSLARNGFFSTRYAQGLSEKDKQKITGLTFQSSNYGGLGPFDSDVVKVGNEPVYFKVYQWEKKFRKSASITDFANAKPDDFITGKMLGWWYYLATADGKTTPVKNKQVTVSIPKGISVWVFCDVRDHDPDRLVCQGNPVCAYNEGPDVGAQPDWACTGWKKSCGDKDSTSYSAGSSGPQQIQFFIPPDSSKQ